MAVTRTQAPGSTPAVMLQAAALALQGYVVVFGTKVNGVRAFTARKGGKIVRSVPVPASAQVVTHRRFRISA